mmetsp:Transcript_7951/g.10157  ORF Transcript_7951/g.10157 Transcript_7951/m.10157 type:complete len:214 (-) Transcript_7951:384-1025(-)
METKSWSKTSRMHTKSRPAKSTRSTTRVHPTKEHIKNIFRRHFFSSSKSRSSTKTCRTGTGVRIRIFVSILIINLTFTFIRQGCIRQSHSLEGFICLGSTIFVGMKFQCQLSIRLFNFTFVGRIGYSKHFIVFLTFVSGACDFHNILDYLFLLWRVTSCSLLICVGSIAVRVSVCSGGCWCIASIVIASPLIIVVIVIASISIGMKSLLLLLL